MKLNQINEMIDDVDFHGNAREIEINGEVYDVVDLDYNELTDPVLVKLFMAQLSFLKGLVENQIEEREVQRGQDEITLDEFREWRRKAKHFLLIINRCNQLCNAKQLQFSQEEKVRRQRSIDRLLISELKAVCDKKVFEDAVRAATARAGD